MVKLNLLMVQETESKPNKLHTCADAVNLAINHFVTALIEQQTLKVQFVHNNATCKTEAASAAPVFNND
jgi:hypothetical protein